MNDVLNELAAAARQRRVNLNRPASPQDLPAATVLTDVGRRPQTISTEIAKGIFKGWLLVTAGAVILVFGTIAILATLFWGNFGSQTPAAASTPTAQVTANQSPSKAITGNPPSLQKTADAGL
jgi:hypothetical protein